MNRMNVPGFSADASLYVNTRTYRLSEAAYSCGNQEVVPQFWREIGNFFSGVGDLIWSTAKCSLATAKVGVHCTAGIWETGNVAACADAVSEWSESCISD